jgi:hypothetical protein
MLDRNQITKTPGKIVFDPTNGDADLRIPLYSSDGISFEVQETLVEVPDQIHGASSQVVTGRLVVVKMKPTSFTAAGLAKLFTHGPAFATRPGTSIIGSTDKIIDVITMDGIGRRLHNAFIFGEPAISCEIGKTILGEVTIYGIVKTGGDSSNINHLFEPMEVGWSDADWNPDHEITPGWSASWSIPGSASAWDDIETMGGVTVTPKSELDEMVNNRDGLVNVTIKNYGVEVKARTFNIDESLVYDARYGGGTQPLGSRKSSLGRIFKLRANGGGAFIYCYGAVMQPQSLTFSAADTVVGDLTWKTDPITSGGRKTHLVVTTFDPDD